MEASMRSLARIFLLMVLVACVVCAQQASRQMPVISIRLAALQPTVKLHGPIKVRATLTNQSKVQISFNQDQFWSNYRFNVSDGNAAVEPKSREVLMERRKLSRLIDRELNPEFYVYLTAVTLEAGASRDEEITISELFSFVHAGTYRIQAIHPDPVSNEPVMSNPISITIVP
jgi:hypothetical protein